MQKKPETTTTDTKRTPDKSPENDLRKALDHLRAARAKYIREGKEESGNHVLEVLGRLSMLLDAVNKPAPAKE